MVQQLSWNSWFVVKDSLTCPLTIRWPGTAYQTIWSLDLILSDLSLWGLYVSKAYGNYLKTIPESWFLEEEIQTVIENTQARRFVSSFSRETFKDSLEEQDILNSEIHRKCRNLRNILLYSWIRSYIWNALYNYCLFFRNIRKEIKLQLWRSSQRGPAPTSLSSAGEK